MHEGVVGVVVVEGGKDLPAGHRGRVAQIAPGEGLTQHQDVRLDQVSHEPVARAAKACGHLVKDQ